MVPYSTPKVNSAASLAALTANLALLLRGALPFVCCWLLLALLLPSLLLLLCFFSFPFTALLPLRTDVFMLSPPAASAPPAEASLYTVPVLPFHPIAVCPGVSAPVPQGVSATEATP